MSRGRHRSGVEGGSKLGNAYVEQARIVRRLWGCGRAGSERGIAGGLDGEARSAFGEQELPVIPTVLAHPRTAADDDDTVVRKKIDSRHKLLPPRPHSRPRRPDFRSELFGCKQKKESVFCFVGFFVSVYAPACLLSPLLSAQGPRRESEIEVDPRTLGGRALPDAEPLFALCVRRGRKADADRAGATAAMDA